MTSQEIENLSLKRQAQEDIERCLGIPLCTHCFYALLGGVWWLQPSSPPGVANELQALLNHCGHKLKPEIHQQIENYISAVILQRNL